MWENYGHNCNFDIIFYDFVKMAKMFVGGIHKLRWQARGVCQICQLYNISLCSKYFLHQSPFVSNTWFLTFISKNHLPPSTYLNVYLFSGVSSTQQIQWFFLANLALLFCFDKLTHCYFSFQNSFFKRNSRNYDNSFVYVLMFTLACS